MVRRRVIPTIALFLLTGGIPLWGYAVIRELRNDYSYIISSAEIGRWSSLKLILMSMFAENKLRRYLVLGAAGLLLFFCISIGELP